jgi:hypothetical protein
MTELEFKIKSDNAKEKFIRLAKKVGDLRPVWAKFIPEYREIVSQNFEAKGKIMEGARWIPLTKRYLKYKQKKHPGKPLMVVTGKMMKAGHDFKFISKEDNLKMTVEGENYFLYTQERKTNPRKWFYTKDYNLPTVAWRMLIEIANDELTKDME